VLGCALKEPAPGKPPPKKVCKKENQYECEDKSSHGWPDNSRPAPRDLQNQKMLAAGIDGNEMKIIGTESAETITVGCDDGKPTSMSTIAASPDARRLTWR
jgi:hypothetical protein